MTATETAAVITEPCVIDGMPDDVYRLDPVPGGSLSSTGARKLIPPSTPAKFKYWLGKEQHKPEFDLGHAAHKEVLGEGMEFRIIDAPDWKTAAARAERDEAYAEGRVPLLKSQHEQVKAMAAEVRRHPLAARLLEPGTGKPEQSLFWQDAETGVNCRARIDWLPNEGRGRRLVVDYKSARSAFEEDFQKSAWSYGYYLQHPFYLRGVRALLDDDPAFVFVVQEVDPPYLVNVIELDERAVHIGELQIDLALRTYAKCMRDDDWPGYPVQVQSVSLPPYILNQFKDDRR